MSRGDDVLRRILSGELDPDSSEARAAAERDPALRVRLAEFASLEARLATIGDELRTGAASPSVGEDATLARFRDVALGPKSARGDGGCIRPVGGVAAYGTFEWTLALPPNGAFELEVFDAHGQIALPMRALDAARWEPSASESARLPARIRWRVTVRESSGPTRSCDTEAWIEPRPAR